uniref:AMP deaminase 2 n=1 Tax=Lygus hesperus TaxID=30085 RepID=A0A0A9XCZ1_LYGHE
MQHIYSLQGLLCHSGVSGFAQRQMTLLERSFELHRVLNPSSTDTTRLAAAKASAAGNKMNGKDDDFYQCVKVNNNIRIEHGFSARQLIQFLQRKVLEHGDDIVNDCLQGRATENYPSTMTRYNNNVEKNETESEGQTPQTLRQLFHDELLLSLDKLTVDDVLFGPSYQTVEHHNNEKNNSSKTSFGSKSRSKNSV